MTIMACLLQCDYFFLRALFWERGFRGQKNNGGYILFQVMVQEVEREGFKIRIIGKESQTWGRFFFHFGATFWGQKGPGRFKQVLLEIFPISGRIGTEVIFGSRQNWFHLCRVLKFG